MTDRDEKTQERTWNALVALAAAGNPDPAAPRGPAMGGRGPRLALPTRPHRARGARRGGRHRHLRGPVVRGRRGRLPGGARTLHRARVPRGGNLGPAVHLLVFPGMPGFFGPASTERGIVYWFAGRVLTIGALLAAARIDRQSESPHLRRGRLLAANLTIVAGVVALELGFPRRHPLFFVEGVGLTPLKVSIEAGIALAAAWVRSSTCAPRRTTGEAAREGRGGVVLSVFGEVCLMLYAHPYDPFNVMHVYFVCSFCFVSRCALRRRPGPPLPRLHVLRAHVEQDELSRRSAGSARRPSSARTSCAPSRTTSWNPLQIVMLQAQRLLRDADDCTRRSAGIITAAKRIYRMLRDLVDSARGGRNAGV